MSVISLILSSSLILIALLVSYHQKIGLGRDIIIGTLRAVIQLSIVGLILKFIFDLNDWPFTLIIVLIMVINASANARKRGRELKGLFILLVISIGTAAFITLSILVFAGVLQFVPSQIIPVSGMIIGNAMVACGLTINRLKEEIKARRDEIEARIALGATASQAALSITPVAVRTGMIPTVDSMKTLGIVQLPGMMTGLILAGTPPEEAIKYQIMVTFMLSSTVAIACFMLSYMIRGKFFNQYHQLTGL